MKKALQLFYLAKWFLCARILGSHRPLQSVVFVTGGCNSTCRHCVHCTATDNHFMGYEEIVGSLKSCYGKGARILDVEGVNLVHWKDDNKSVGDIFNAAKEIGFYNISTMIPARFLNEWTDLNVTVDVLWVSIQRKEDMDFLSDDCHYSLYLVINRQNYKEVPFILEEMKKHNNILQIAFNFHTPFAGTEGKELSPEERKEVIEGLIAYKKRGYAIMNTVSGLKNMLSLDFKRYCWICNFVYCDGRQSPVCIDDERYGLCGKCGFCMSGEMNAVFRFKLDTILAGLKSRGGVKSLGTLKVR